MSIITLQKRLAEIGRIRIGKQVPTSSGGKRPAKLDTFRLTSRDKTRIDAAAQLWGGTVESWEAPSGGQWEVITETDVLDVIVPPSAMAFSQYYELWSAGGCQRRCDGVTELISDQPCICDPDKPDCSIHSRLSVMLRDLPGLGVWRVDTSGYYAAVELSGSVQILEMAAGAGTMLPARLRLEQRAVKRPGQGTRKFAVPVLDIEVTPGALMSGGAVDAPALLTPVPASLPSAPVGSIAEQAVAFPERKSRGQVPIPATDVEIVPVGTGEDQILLARHFGDLPDEEDTMPLWEAWLRQLFELMASTGRWGGDALHASLEKHGFAHVGDMKKAELVVFATQAHDAAVKAVGAADGE